MRKNRGLYVLALLLLLVVAATLVACGEDQGQGGLDNSHEHHYVEIVGDAYLKSAATCETGNVYYVACNVCGIKGSETFVRGEGLGHVGGSATCAKHAVCERCGKEYGDLAAHSFDEGKVTKEPTCTEEGAKTQTCTVCGKTEDVVVPPSHKGEWYTTAEPRCFDNGERQRICTVCDTIETQSIPAYHAHDLKDATCEGGKACTRCGYVEGVGTGHVFGGWTVKTAATCEDKGVEKRTCLVCGKDEERQVSATGHSYGKWTVDEQATCTTNGTESHVCSVCGDIKHRTIDKLAHEGEWVTTKEPTCTQNSKAKQVCVHCGTETEKTLYATGHKGEWEVENPATCTVNGSEKRICTVCGEKTTRIVYAAHHYSDWVTETESTCTEAGVKVSTCSECGDRKTLTINKKEHEGEWVVITAPTCVNEGVQRQTCTVCGQQTNKAVNPTGHDMHPGTCTTPAKCSKCGFEADIVGHKYGEERVIETPDCTRSGYNTKTCEICGYVDTTYVQPSGHNYGDWETRKEMTCLENGKARHVCINCNHAEDKILFASGHDYGDWIYDVEPTCTDGGHRYRVCSRCNEKESEDLAALGHDFGEKPHGVERVCSRCKIVVGPHEYGEDGCPVCGLAYSDVYYKAVGDEKDPDSYCVMAVNSVQNGVLFIRKTYNGKPVLSIGTLNLDSTVTAIILPDGITSISEGAFANTGIKEITIPDTVVEIGEDVLAGCSSLEKITFGYSKDQYGNAQDFTLGYLFGTSSYTGGVETIQFDKDNRPIYYYVPASLKSVTITSGDIPGNAFENCIGLTNVTIGNAVASIGEDAFKNCTGLTSIVISDSVTSIGSNAFYHCTGLTSVIIPNSVTSIGRDAFCDTGLTSVNIPASVTRIEDNTFRDTPITSIFIPKSVTSIGGWAFGRCFELMRIEYGGTKAEWESMVSRGYLWRDDIPSDCVVVCSDGEVSIDRY